MFVPIRGNANVIPTAIPDSCNVQGSEKRRLISVAFRLEIWSALKFRSFFMRTA